MIVVVVCGLLLLFGVAVASTWSREPFRALEPTAEPSAVEVARRFVWYSSIVIVAGVASGITVAGAGGRLAMRLLAVTGGDAAQGRRTEANEVVGEITAGGTIGFIIFNGILPGIAAVAMYLIIRRVLPAGSLGGVVFGLGLLVVIGTTSDPLRDENADFDLVGPGWVAVVVFVVLAVVFGVALVGFAARLSAWLPLPSTERRVLFRYLLPAALAVIGFAVTAVFVVIGVAVVVASRWRPLRYAVRSSRTVLVGRVASVGLVLAALPNATLSIADIASR